MPLVTDEIRDQPRAWAKAVELGRSSAEVLPAGERVAVVGCGSSWHAAKAIASLRESLGRGETDAFPGSEAWLEREYDRIVVISRSGTTSEIRAALGKVRPGITTVALVGDTDSPVADACDSVVDLGFANDLAVVQTRFVTTVLCFARSLLDPELPDLLPDAEAALAEAHPVPPGNLDRAVVLGRGWRAGVADAAALALRETAVMWAESYPAMEYRHGPIATAGPGAVIWMLDEPPTGLVDEIAATGATTVSARFDPLAELIRIQRMAVAMAEFRGLDPDQPANLQRSVVLDFAEADDRIRGES